MNITRTLGYNCSMNISSLQLVDKTFTNSTVDTRLIKLRKFVPQITEYQVKDFVVDGVSMITAIMKADDSAPERSAGPQYAWLGEWKNEYLEDWRLNCTEYLERLLCKAPADMPSGRTAVYLCPCGDPMCGTLACRITIGAKTVTWSDFEWDGPEAYRESIDGQAWCKVEGLRDRYVFDRREYEALLGKELKLYQTVAPSLEAPGLPYSD